MSQTPYSNLPARNFWKTAISGRSDKELFTQVWEPKYDINKKSKFMTAGSCFAQHISQWLMSNEYTWLDAEPAPKGMGSKEAKEAGHGVFSIRTGNIYSARLLRQWTELIVGDADFAEEFIETDGVFFDPLRPLIPQEGYLSKELVLEARRKSLDNAKDAFLQADVFVFTLGLTEGWVHKDGYAYPLCPGVLKGEFNPDVHKFVNDDYSSILSDMEWVIGSLKKLNPKLKFLLTVSPVPLTATASDQHVLNATSYSKSILRSVAGTLVESSEDVDYFPSYEIISSFPSKAALFDDNLRTVSQSGVDFVMRHFESGMLQECSDIEITPRAVVEINEGVVCEEIAIESANRIQPEDNVDICLIGDSNMGMLSDSLSRMGIPHFGGCIMDGSAWLSGQFVPDEEDLFVPLQNRRSRDMWNRTQQFFNFDKIDTEGKIVFVNFVTQTHRAVTDYVDWALESGVEKYSADNLAEWFVNIYKNNIILMTKIVETGARVVVVTDPPTQSLFKPFGRNIKYFELFDDVVEALFPKIGCEVFHARRHFNEVGFREEYYSKTVFSDGQIDWYHGSQEYYDQLAKELKKIYFADKSSNDTAA